MRKYLEKTEKLISDRRLPWSIKRRLKKEYFIMLTTKMIFRLVARTSPIQSHNDSNYEVCTLLDRNNVYPYLLAIKSLSEHSPIRFRATVVSDGSLREREKSLLRKHIQEINIYDPFDIRDSENDHLNAMMRARNAYHTIRKTWDIYHAVKSEIIIFLDSDVIFLNNLDKWIFDISDERQMVYNRDHDHSVRDPLFHLTKEFIKEYNIKIVEEITDLNCGFMIFSREAFKMDIIQEYIYFLYKRSSFHTVMEQDCWNIVASTIPSVAMPDRYVVGDYGEQFRRRLQRSDLISVHFVGGIRYKSFAYLNYALDFLKAFKNRT